MKKTISFALALLMVLSMIPASAETAYTQAPYLDGMDLPPVAERLPLEPMVEDADYLTIGESFVEPGNWAGFPGHKHDVDNMPAEAAAEEIYYFLFQPEQGFAIQCLYTKDGEYDEAYRVKNDDLVEFPYGYHTTVSTPGYQTYFLWLMAGDYQGFNRSNDPIHDWVK